MSKKMISQRDLQINIFFHPPDKRRYDLDNMVARMKAGIDGVCDALGFDDFRFGCHHSEIYPPKDVSYVYLTISKWLHDV